MTGVVERRYSRHSAATRRTTDPTRRFTVTAARWGFCIIRDIRHSGQRSRGLIPTLGHRDRQRRMTTTTCCRLLLVPSCCSCAQHPLVLISPPVASCTPNVFRVSQNADRFHICATDLFSRFQGWNKTSSLQAHVKTRQELRNYRNEKHVTIDREH